MRRRFIEKTEKERSAALYDTADGMDESQYEIVRSRPPIKSVIYIIGFLLAGTVCITISALIFGGYIDEKYSDRVWPLFILGGILLIPGGYYGFILFCIIFGFLDYTLDDILVL